MPYLTGRAENRFEGRMNTFREGHSPQLASTIKAVKTYLVEPTAARIRDVKFCWVAWKVQKLSLLHLAIAHARRPSRA
jgi:hypothetical protein